MADKPQEPGPLDVLVDGKMEQMINKLAANHKPYAKNWKGFIAKLRQETAAREPAKIRKRRRRR